MPEYNDTHRVSQNNSVYSIKVAQLEHRRLAYLEAMGIQTWFPRYQLINTAPPRLIYSPSDDSLPASIFKPENNQCIDTETNVDAASVTSDLAQYHRTRASDILNEFISTPTTSVAVKEPDSSTKIEKTPHSLKHNTPASPFRLIIESIGTKCLLIAEMPHSGLNQFSRFHQNLLNDLLRALKLPSVTLKKPREFIWPISHNQGLFSRLDQDEQAATDAVQAFLNNQFGMAKRSVLLILGQSAARFTVDAKKSFEHLRGIKKSKTSEQWFATSYSLNELMKKPSLKPEVWKDLAPLHHEISNLDH